MNVCVHCWHIWHSEVAIMRSSWWVVNVAESMHDLHSCLVGALFINPLGDDRGDWGSRLIGSIKCIIFSIDYQNPSFFFEEKIQISSYSVFCQLERHIHIPLPFVTISNHFPNYPAKLLATPTEHKITYIAFSPSKQSAQSWSCAHCGEEQLSAENGWALHQLLKALHCISLLEQRPAKGSTYFSDMPLALQESNLLDHMA